MKILLWFIFLPFLLFSINVEPLVRVDTLTPIEVSSENRLLYEKRTTPQEALHVFNSRNFPLGKLLLGLACIASVPAFLFYIRQFLPIKMPNSKTALLKMLKELEETIHTQELHKDHYLRLNGKMREYLQERFGINAPFLTTEEFLKQASENEKMDQKNQETLKTFLKESDRVKFKGKNPTFQDLDVCLRLIHKLVKN